MNVTQTDKNERFAKLQQMAEKRGFTLAPSLDADGVAEADSWAIKFMPGNGCAIGKASRAGIDVTKEQVAEWPDALVVPYHLGTVGTEITQLATIPELSLVCLRRYTVVGHAGGLMAIKRDPSEGGEKTYGEYTIVQASN